MKKTILVLMTTLLIVNLTSAQNALKAKHFNLENSLAIQGYDPVAYFISNKAQQGLKQFAAVSEGVIYYFSSAKNKEMFLKAPKKFEPQYGGWCAYAMSANEKVEIDPETFKIVNGKLYLFYHSWTNNTLTKWNANEAVLKQNADKNWAKIFQ